MNIHIFGASGSGVTTLGRALSAESGYPYFDSDDYFWEPTEPPYTNKRNATVRNEMMRAALLSTSNWIVGGSVVNWGNDVFPVFDLVVFLHLPKAVRMQRLMQREFERYGEVIYTNEQRAKTYKDFLAWAGDYDENTGLANRTLQAHEQWLAACASPVLRLGDMSKEERLDAVWKKICELNTTQ